MRRLHIDIETYSSEDLSKCGVYRYSASEDFAIILIAYAIDEGPTRIIETGSGEERPAWFDEALEDPNVIKMAHNAHFERVCLGSVLGRTLDPRQWGCSMVQAARCGLPLSLAQVGAALGLERQKMTEGVNLIRLFCTPQDSPLFKMHRVLPSEAPDKWRIFCDYCIRDVDVEREIVKATEWLKVSSFERELYALDQEINDRGVLVDLDFVEKASAIDATYKAHLNIEAIRLTGMDNPNSVTQLKGWLSSRGVDVDSLDRKMLADLRSGTEGPVRRMLEIRSEMAKTSCKKYDTIKSTVSADGRVRGLTQFHAARTGRWAGRLVQMQNLPQNHIEDLDFARQCVYDMDVDTLSLGYGNVPDVLSQLIRTAFVASPGRTLAVCDFSAIEARVIAWLAGEDWVLDVFRSGRDIYCETAAMMFKVPVEKHGANAALRQKGKIAVLALGYGGGVRALEAMGGARMGLSADEMKEIVDKWRAANPAIVSLWSDLETAAYESFSTRGAVEARHLTFAMCLNGAMTVTLPSGRMIVYPDLALTTNRFGRTSLKFRGIDQKTRQWGWIETYGGKLTENIVQAIARDCLAEVITKTEHARFPIVFHVHDEIICEVDRDADLQSIQAIFAEPVRWAPGLPLKGAGYTTKYYKKD